MDVKQAVTLAVSQIAELFQHEEITNLGLEEVQYDQPESSWTVTVGFSRPWDYPPQSLNALANLTGQAAKPSRSFKVVIINDNNGEVIAIKNRSAN